MQFLHLFAVLISTLTVTSYRSVPAQTKPTGYFFTSINERVNNHGAAISQDMLCPIIVAACKSKTMSEDRILSIKKHHAADCKYKNHIHYGDTIYIERYGFKVVNDCMGLTKLNKDTKKHFREPIHRAVDMWVASFPEEKAVGTRTLKVWLVRDVPFNKVPGPVRSTFHDEEDD